MENYTLQRFYHEAKAIVEKYNLNFEEEYEFYVEFKLEETTRCNHPLMKCIIHFSPKRYESRGTSFYSYCCTPAAALSSFEEDIKEKTGSPIRERVSVEIENKK